MVPVALGSQTAGSIVRPASFCGVYGFKPSFGLIPRTGTLKTTDSLDTLGFFTGHAEDLETVFQSVTVHGRDYPMSAAALDDPIRQRKPDCRPWRVVVFRSYLWQYFYAYAKEAFLRWVSELSKDTNIEIVEMDLPEVMSRSHEIHSTIYDRALAYYFEREAKRKELVSPIMYELIKHGRTITKQEYHQALKDQETLISTMDDLMVDFDAGIGLSTAGEAPLREETERPDEALIWTLTHLPVVSAPVFVSARGLPFGAQIFARKYNDVLLLEFIGFLLSRRMIPERSNPMIGIRD
jgi:Asp-tRNA(Asn)/Glu-tRNA(Gln) amidotransferase A subunit family amidase